MTPSLPGSKMWNASLLSYVQVTDWDFNNGGVIIFDDGTLWSYDAESPAAGELDGYTWNGFCITERKVGSDVWERLTPDTWGIPWIANPPDYPNWPSSYTQSGDVWDGDHEGPLNVATIGTGTGWGHIQYPDDSDNVLFYSVDGDWVGPVTVNRHTRRWKTNMRSEAAADLWDSIGSNVVTDGVYFYFAVWPSYPVEGLQFARCPIGDLEAVELVHEWANPQSWWRDIDTSNITLPDYIDNQYMYKQPIPIAIDGDWIYFFTPYNVQLLDVRTTPSAYGASESDRNHDMKYQALRRFKIGEYRLETLLWHSSPQGWVGYGGAGRGTFDDHTLGITTKEDRTAFRYNYYPAIGMGMKASNWHAMEIHNGWLYWLDLSNERVTWNMTYGCGHMICRIDLAKLDPSEPIHHDVMNPAFEILTNGTVPWEGGWTTGHYGSGGHYLEGRTGAQPLMPFGDFVPFTFDNDGNMLYKGMVHPPYYSSDTYGYGTRVIYKLTPNVKSMTDVVVTFTGDELKGYTNARQVPVTRDVMEVELS